MDAILPKAKLVTLSSVPRNPHETHGYTEHCLSPIEDLIQGSGLKCQTSSHGLKQDQETCNTQPSS
jgi:hypothetical protein